jgi:hypothetical protein
MQEKDEKKFFLNNKQVMRRKDIRRRDKENE